MSIDYIILKPKTNLMMITFFSIRGVTLNRDIFFCLCMTRTEHRNILVPLFGHRLMKKIAQLPFGQMGWMWE